MNTKNRGFTFVEVLIAILIMGIVGGTAIHLFGLSQMFVDRQISSAVRLNAERFTIDSIYAELHKGSIASIDILSTESPLVNDAVSNYKYIFRNNNGHVILREWSADAGGAGVGASVDRQLLGAEGVQSLMFSLSNDTNMAAAGYMLLTNVVAHGVTRPEEGLERTIGRRIGLLGRPDKNKGGVGVAAVNNTYTGSAVRFAFFVAPDTGPLGPAALVHHVTKTGADTNSGESWEEAYASVQKAVDEAAKPGARTQEVWVAAGTYSGAALGKKIGDAYTLELKKGVKLYGGFDGYQITSDERNYSNTTLSGDNKYQVIRLVGIPTNQPTSTDTRIDGFTITGGSADNGAGLYLSYASPTIANCIFSGDIATGNGGGIYNSKSSPIVSNCTFLNNSATDGGGMWISSYLAPHLSSIVTMTSCDFSKNNASGNGGGMHIVDTSGGTTTTVVTMTSCDFSENVTSEDGGGMYVHGGSVKVTMIGSTFSKNISQVNNKDVGGGGIFIGSNSVASIDISAFLGNEAARFGGGIRNSGSTSLMITRSTFSENKTKISVAQAGGGGIYSEGSTLITVMNSTFSKNTAIGSTGNPFGGGAINNAGVARIINCTFSQNVVTSTSGVNVGGGAILNRGSGGIIASINTIFRNNENRLSNYKNIYNRSTIYLTNCILNSGDVINDPDSGSIGTDVSMGVLSPDVTAFSLDLKVSPDTYLTISSDSYPKEVHYYVPVQSNEVKSKGVKSATLNGVLLTAPDDDQLSNPRSNLVSVDIGAYEFQ